MILNDKYTVKRKIGEGEFSTCWEASVDDTLVVIKVQKINNDKNTARFEKEIELFNILNNENENVIKMIDNFVHKTDTGIESQCIVFEKMDTDLWELIEESETGLEVSIVKDLCRQIIDGIRFLHSKNIVHTDLKPDNILIKKKENGYKAVITDLGNARMRSEGKFIESVLEYNAIEFVLNGEQTEKVDIWSIGCMVFEMLTNNYLFDVRSYLNSIYDYDLSSSDSDDTVEYSNSDSESESEDDFLKNKMYLNLCVSTLGDIPLYCIRNTEDFDTYFNKNGLLKSPIKILKQKSIYKTLVFDYNFEPDIAKQIEEFILPMLNYDYKKRSNAAQVLESKFLN